MTVGFSLGDRISLGSVLGVMDGILVLGLSDGDTDGVLVLLGRSDGDTDGVFVLGAAVGTTTTPDVVVGAAVTTVLGAVVPVWLNVSSSSSSLSTREAL